MLQRVCQFYLGSRPLRPSDVTVYALVSPTCDWRDKVGWLEQQGVKQTPEMAEPLVFADDPAYQFFMLVQQPDAVERLKLPQQRGSLVTRRFENKYEPIFEVASSYANVPLMRYICEHDLLENRVPKVFKYAMSAAAQDGDVAVMSELKALGARLTVEAAMGAARQGNLHVLQWMAGPEAGPEGEAALLVARARLTHYAAESGSIEVVRWARERGSPWAEGTFTKAASSGNVALLEMLVAEGCPMQVRPDKASYLGSAPCTDHG